MTVQTFTLLNNGNVDLTVTGIEFNTPAGVIHSANLTNFSGGTASFETNSFATSTPISSGTYKVFTLDYGYDGATSLIYLRNVEVSSNLASVTTLTSTIIVGKGSLNTPATLSNSGETFTDYQENTVNGFAFITLKVKSNGVLEISNSSEGTILSKSWVDPYPFNGIGNNFYVRFLRTVYSGSGIYNSSVSTDWLSLASTREFTVNATGLSDGTPSSATSTFTVEISDDPSGIPLLSSGTYTFNPTGKLAGLITNISDVYINDFASPNSRAYINLNPNGNIEVYKQSTNKLEVVGLWYLNGGANIGNSHFVKVTKIAGTDFDNLISSFRDVFTRIDSNDRRWGISSFDFDGLKVIQLKFELTREDQVVASTFNVTITVNTPPTPIFFGVNARQSSVTEGQTIFFDISTTYVPVGTVIYWQLVDKLGNLKKEDFQNYNLFNPLAGSITVDVRGANQTPVINRIIALNTVFSSEFGNNREFSMIVSDTPFVNDGVSQETFRAESQTVSVSDEAPSYSITVDKSSVNEGDIVTFKIYTNNVQNGTTLYWFTVGSGVNTDDVSIAGSFQIYNNRYDLKLTVKEDRTTEGKETFQLRLRDKAITYNEILDGQGPDGFNYVVPPIVATSPTVTINDTSLSPTYSIRFSGSTTRNEGSIVLFDFVTTNVLDGTQFWWNIEGSSGISIVNDFNIVPENPFVLNGNYRQLLFKIAEDSLTDPGDTFAIRVYTFNPGWTKLGNYVAKSVTVTINDTSQTPAPVYYADGNQTVGGGYGLSGGGGAVGNVTDGSGNAVSDGTGGTVGTTGTDPGPGTDGTPAI